MNLDQILEKKIVSSIATMDRRMLDVLLPDHGVYDNTYKEVWLSKLFALYDECLLAGDETMTVYERMCTDENHALYGQKLYIFCAPESKRCLMVAFKLKDGNLYGLVQYYRYNLIRKENMFDPTHSIKVGIYIYANETIGYIETEAHKEHKKAVVEFEMEIKNSRRKVIGRKWLLMMTQKYDYLYQNTRFDFHCEEVARLNVMISDFNNMYSFMRKPGSYVSLYTKYKALTGKDDQTSVLKRRKLIADNMLILFRFFTSSNFGMNEQGEFTYSYNIDNQKYSVKLHLRDQRIEVAGYFPFIKECNDVILHFFDAYKRDVSADDAVYWIEDVADHYKGKTKDVVMEM